MLAIAPRPETRHCLLIVDDEVLVRIGIAEALRGAGYLVLEASNAAEALTVLRARPEVALVFTDIRMPGEMDGMGLVHVIRDQFQHLKVIVTSAIRPKEPVEMFVPKPYDIDRLVMSIRDVLE
jgi:CheY-like chemotaxis protein